MSNILLIETATQFCSVALSVDGKVVSTKEQSGQNLHASNLTLFIEDVIQQAGMSYKELDAVAISKGPGSYTGLRIGVSTSKGICFALDIPLISLETLKMMAEGFLAVHKDYRGLVCPMIDARRMEVYTAVFDHEVNTLETTHAKIIDSSSYNSFLKDDVVTFIGDGAEKCTQLLTSPNVRFDLWNFNSAENMATSATNSFKANNFEDLAYFEPFYLKDFVVTKQKVKTLNI